MFHTTPQRHSHSYLYIQLALPKEATPLYTVTSVCDLFESVIKLLTSRKAYGSPKMPAPTKEIRMLANTFTLLDVPSVLPLLIALSASAHSFIGSVVRNPANNAGYVKERRPPY